MYTIYMTSPTHGHAIILTAITGFVTGGGLQRFLVYVAHVMPPLPAQSGWWTQLFYAMVKGVSGLDPSSTVVPPPGGKQ